MAELEKREEQRLQRWRLVLGGKEADGIGVGLGAEQMEMDRALGALYGEGEEGGDLGGGRGGRSKRGGSGASRPNVARWLGDIRKYFPTSVVQLMQKDALERLNLQQMLLEREMLEAVEPDVHLVATLISLNRVIPEKTRETARSVVRKVVEELMKRLADPTRQAVRGSLNRAVQNRRPRHTEIDWRRTIRANLRHYQPEYKTIVPERLVGYGRKSRSMQKEVILCVDQSGSMASSVVYSSIFGAVLASLRALKTHMVVFDTSVVDLTEELRDPVDLLFGTQLGGGTDINRALAYCQGLITRPRDTVLVLISDLCEGGDRSQMLQRAAALVASGVRVIALLALSDEGRPSYDSETAGLMASLRVPAFACTPDLFPELMAAALQSGDIAQWAAIRGIETVRARE